MTYDDLSSVPGLSWSNMIDEIAGEFGTTDLKFRGEKEVSDCLRILQQYPCTICLPDGDTEEITDMKIYNSGFSTFHTVGSDIIYDVKSIQFHHIYACPIESFFVIDNCVADCCRCCDETKLDFIPPHTDSRLGNNSGANSGPPKPSEKWNRGRMLLCSQGSILASYDQIEKSNPLTYDDECIETIKRLYRVRFGARRHVLSILPL